MRKAHCDKSKAVFAGAKKVHGDDSAHDKTLQKRKGDAKEYSSRALRLVSFPSFFWKSLAAGIAGGDKLFGYLPSLQSDFVYDAKTEILKEGFITSTANLPDVVTLKVLG